MASSMGCGADGQEIHEAKDRAEFEKQRESIDARYDALPECLRQRIDKFRDNNPDFRWKYEGYELFVCEEAVKIAEALKTDKAIVDWKRASRSQILALTFRMTILGILSDSPYSWRVFLRVAKKIKSLQHMVLLHLLLEVKNMDVYGKAN